CAASIASLARAVAVFTALSPIHRMSRVWPVQVRLSVARLILDYWTRRRSSSAAFIRMRYLRARRGADVKGAGNSGRSQQRGSLIQSLPDRDPQPERQYQYHDRRGRSAKPRLGGTRTERSDERRIICAPGTLQ